MFLTLGGEFIVIKKKNVCMKHIVINLTWQYSFSLESHHLYISQDIASWVGDCVMSAVVSLPHYFLLFPHCLVYM